MSTATISGHRTQTTTVLLIEDDVVDQTVVRRALASQNSDYDLICVPLLLEGIKILSQDGIDVVLLDLSLPDSTPEQTFPALKAHSADIPVIVLTNFGDTKMALEAVGAGAQDFLLKSETPLPTNLIRSIRYSVARSRSDRALREAQAKLLQAQKMEAIGRLAGGIAHDFNNLLTAIFIYGSFILNELEPESSARLDMEGLLQTAKKAERLTSQLLSFSRRRTISPTIVQLNACVRGVEQMLHRVLGEDIEFTTTLYDDLWNVKVDPSALEHVLINLAVNARDAMPEGGKLTIRTSNAEIQRPFPNTQKSEIPSGQYVCIEVSDTGIGMDKETKEQIFEPFFTTKETGRGTGLGLATCYGIVQQAGGFIQVNSEPGKSTTFEIYLPRSTARRSATREPETTSAKSGRLYPSFVILVVEDDKRLRDLAVRSLASLGCRILSAESGAQAKALYEQEGAAIDVLLTDVIMTGMTGRTLATQLQELQPNLQVLYMSGYPSDALAHRGMLEEGVELLQKPFTPTRLRKKVRQIFDRVRAEG